MKYELTSKLFDGNIIFEYSDDEVFVTVENNAKLSVEQLLAFRNCFPIHVATLNIYKEQSGMCIRLLNENITFDMFYEEFGRKEAKQDAMKRWEKMKPIDQQRAFAYIKRYKSILARTPGREQLLPASYLGKRLWEDNA
jgi:hypothetical protein